MFEIFSFNIILVFINILKNNLFLLYFISMKLIYRFILKMIKEYNYLCIHCNYAEWKIRVLTFVYVDSFDLNSVCFIKLYYLFLGIDIILQLKSVL